MLKMRNKKKKCFIKIIKNENRNLVEIIIFKCLAKKKV